MLGHLRNCSYLLSFVLLLGLLACKPPDTASGRPIRVVRPQQGLPAVTTPMGVAGAAPAPGTGTAGSVAPDPQQPQAGAAAMMTMPPGQSTGMAGMSVPQAGSVAPPAARTFNAGTDPARNMVKAGQVCARLAQIQCAGEEYCCENPGRDRAACETAMRDTCVSDGFVDAVTLDARSGFDAARAASALQMFESMASMCDVKIGDFGADPNGLMGMVRGTVAEGGRCSPGAGSKAMQAGALASCQSPSACLPSSALSWSCVRPGQAGANCFSDLNCQNGLYCPNPDFQINRTQCLARKADGMPCELGNECMTLTCTAGRCAPATKNSAYCLKDI